MTNQDTSHDRDWWAAHIAAHEIRGVAAPSLCCYFDDEPVSS